MTTATTKAATTRRRPSKKPTRRPVRGQLVDSRISEQIIAEHQACENAYRSACQHAYRAGELLLRAKEEAGHGNWDAWREKNVPSLSERTAQVYMQIAKSFANPQSAADLTIAQALRQISQPKSGAASKNDKTADRSAFEKYVGLEEDVEKASVDATWELAYWLAKNVRRPGQARSEGELTIADIANEGRHSAGWLKDAQAVGAAWPDGGIGSLTVHTHAQELRRVEGEIPEATKALKRKAAR